MVIVVEAVLPVIGYVQIWPTIIVVINGYNTVSPSFICNTCLRGYVGEGAVMIVAEQGCFGRGLFPVERVKRRSIDEVNIQPAVVVEVEQRDTRTLGFKNELFFGSSSGVVPCC